METIFAPFRSLARLWRKPDTVTIANPESLAQTVPPPAKGTLILHLDDFTALQRRLRDDARADLAAAHGAEKQQYQDRIDALNARLANPDEALAQQQAIITDLEAKLARQGNTLGGDDVLAARTALEKGDFTAARALFETLSARTAPDVQTHAEAEYALGQIAEADIRWHDAAAHYARAAALNPTFETLYEARKFAWRTGDYPAAARLGALLLETAGRDPNETRLAVALNENGLTLQAQGRFAEAEGLFGQALEIDRRTIGTDHPGYATGLNNLAGVLQAQGRLAEAEGLYGQALEIGRKTIGTEHPTYAIHLNNLAGVVEAQGRWAEAREFYRPAVTIRRVRLGNVHPSTQGGAYNLLDLLIKHFPDDPDIPMLRAIAAPLLVAAAPSAPPSTPPP